MLNFPAAGGLNQPEDFWGQLISQMRSPQGLPLSATMPIQDPHAFWGVQKPQIGELMAPQVGGNNDTRGRSGISARYANQTGKQNPISSLFPGVARSQDEVIQYWNDGDGSPGSEGYWVYNPSTGDNMPWYAWR